MPSLHKLCTCEAQLIPHDWLPEVCPTTIIVLPPDNMARLAVEFPVGSNLSYGSSLLVDPDLEDETWEK